MFQDMIGAIEYDVTRTMMKAQIHEQERERVQDEAHTTATKNIAAKTINWDEIEGDEFENIGRNDKCPCDSGKKYKNCHGRRF